VEIEWRGEGVDEQGVDVKSGRVMVEVNPQFFRPLELNFLLGDSLRRVRFWIGRRKLVLRRWSRRW
jgi:GDP-D-mannose dehydratase